MQEAELDMTTAAMSNRRTTGDEYLAVKFYKHPRKNPDKSLKAGRPIVEDITYVEILQPGNKDSIIRRPATERDKQRFAQHYSMWMARTSETAEQLVGTPLTEWAGVTRGQVDELSFFNIRTVEQLANMADSNSGQMMGMLGLKEKAAKYLETSTDQATVNKLSALEEDNRKMRDQLKILMADRQTQQTAPPAPPAVSPEIVLEQPHADYGAVEEEEPAPEPAPTRRKRRK